MRNIFNSVKATRAKRNVFDLTHDVKLSLDMGYLYPTCCIEAIPGDKFSIACESMMRLAPMVAPPMHRINWTNHYFFVPHRILWEKFDKWISDQPDPVTIPAFPTVVMDGTFNAIGMLADYLGIPPVAAPGETEVVSAIPFAVYQCIYNEYYRDQNQIQEIPWKLINGDNTANTELFTIRKRAWEHDYFTSALPTPQSGTAVTIPIDGFNDVPVMVNPLEPPKAGGYIKASEALTPGPGNIDVGYTVEQNTSGPEGQLMAKTSDIDQMSTTITDLRRAEAIQKWLERMNVSGKRLKEFIWGMFGIESQDQRLDRPEYITGTKSPIVISEVLNTTGTTDRPQGDMAGHGMSVTSGKYASYTCYEHGYIMCIMSVTPMTAYQDGIARHWLKYKNAQQHFFNQFEHIGEQEIENREVYAFQGAAAGDSAFGYTPRYAEYKFEQNRVAGDFRNTLQFWHLGRKFNTAPALNQEFLECTPRLDIFAVESGPQHLWAHVLHNIKATRGMSKFGTPSI